MSTIEQFLMFYTDLESMKVEHLKNIYSKDVVFIDPIAHHKGLAAVEAYFSKLLKNAKFCVFTIHNTSATEDAGYVINWTMRFTSSRINKGKPVSVDGITVLQLSDDIIVHHRDYYDLGQMVYEHVPLLGSIIKRIKRSLS